MTTWERNGSLAPKGAPASERPRAPGLQSPGSHSPQGLLRSSLECVSREQCQHPRVLLHEERQFLTTLSREDLESDLEKQRAMVFLHQKVANWNSLQGPSSLCPRHAPGYFSRVTFYHRVQSPACEPLGVWWQGLEGPKFTQFEHRPRQELLGGRRRGGR